MGQLERQKCTVCLEKKHGNVHMAKGNNNGNAEKCAALVQQRVLMPHNWTLPCNGPGKEHPSTPSTTKPIGLICPGGVADSRATRVGMGSRAGTYPVECAPAAAAPQRARDGRQAGPCKWLPQRASRGGCLSPHALAGRGGAYCGAASCHGSQRNATT